MKTESPNSNDWTLHASSFLITIVAIGSISVEIWTDRWMARAMGFDFFMSIPLGVAAIFITGLCIRHPNISAIPPIILTTLYWVLFVWGLM